MSEQKIEYFLLGDNDEEMFVEVYFDYQPHKPATETNPSTDAEVTINQIMAPRIFKPMDLKNLLNRKTLDAIELACLELMSKEVE